MSEINIRDLLSSAYFQIADLRKQAIDSSTDKSDSPNQKFRNGLSPESVEGGLRPLGNRDELWGVFVLSTGAMNQTLGSIVSALGKSYLHSDVVSIGYQRWPSEAVFPLARSCLEISATLAWLFED